MISIKDRIVNLFDSENVVLRNKWWKLYSCVNL